MFDINLLNEKNFLRLTQRLINNVLKKDKRYYINIRKKYDRYILRLLNGFYVDETLNLFYRRLDSDIILTDLIELKVALNFLYSIIGKKFKTVQVACLKQKNDEKEMQEFFKQYFNYDIGEIYDDGLFVKVENLTVKKTSYGSTWVIEKFKILSFNKFKKEITKLIVDFNINNFYSKIDNIINFFKKDYIQNKFLKEYKEYRLKKIDKLLSKYLSYIDNHRTINEHKVHVIKKSDYIYNTIVYKNGKKIIDSELDIRNEKDCETLMKFTFNYYTKDYFEY